MEPKVEQQFTEIVSKVKKLKGRIIRLETENEALKKSVMSYLQLLDEHKKNAERISQQENAAQLNSAIQKDKKALQKDLDKYISLIDKCIASIETKV
ncbi:MAG: hypothetical protein KA198_11060 [Chitinophagaceae bacterium]|nr:hypothetical protein [Chitinophagaceae bacterium]